MRLHTKLIAVAYLASCAFFVMSGEQLFNDNCAVCHGIDGRGDIAGTPDFTKLLIVEPSRIKYGYDSGKGGLTMPAHPHLTIAEVNALVIYIQQFKG